MAAPTISPGNSGTKPIRQKPKELPFPLNLYQTSVGKKWAMAVTGLMMLGFVLAHMVGNLKLYLGEISHEGHVDFNGDGMAYDVDIYAEYLRELLVPLLPHGYTLWILRLGLIAALAVHLHAAYALTVANKQANVRYESKQDWLSANFASRTMRKTGLIVLAYLIFHIADLTLGIIPGYDFQSEHVYENVVGSLSNPIVALFYIVANVLLCVHLFHGIWSMFQTLGINNPAYNGLRRNIAAAFSAIILLGNISFPIAVLAGVIDV